MSKNTKFSIPNQCTKNTQTHNNDKSSNEAKSSKNGSSSNFKAVELLKEIIATKNSLIFQINTSKKENKLLYEPLKQIFIIEIKEKPIDGKANKEIIKFLHSLTKKRINIVSGLNSKVKKIEFF